jgi:type VI protein secretion system component VasA
VAENDKDHKSNREKDRFTKLMFRGSKQSDNFEKNEDESQDRQEQNYRTNFERKTSGFDDWFLGKRKSAPEKKTQSTLIKIEDTLKNVDLELLLETIDMFVTTSKQYKPLIKEFSPFISRFIKKFKSNATE